MFDNSYSSKYALNLYGGYQYQFLGKVNQGRNKYDFYLTDSRFCKYDHPNKDLFIVRVKINKSDPLEYDDYMPRVAISYDELDKIMREEINVFELMKNASENHAINISAYEFNKLMNYRGSFELEEEEVNEM